MLQKVSFKGIQPFFYYHSSSFAKFYISEHNASKYVCGCLKYDIADTVFIQEEIFIVIIKISFEMK